MTARAGRGQLHCLRCLCAEPYCDMCLGCLCGLPDATPADYQLTP